MNRIRFTLSGDLTYAWSDFGGVAAQFNHLAAVLVLTVSGHAGIAIAYDFQTQQLIQKLANGRSTRADYFGLLSSINRDIRTDILSDFEAKTEAIKKEREKEKGTKETTTKKTENQW